MDKGHITLLPNKKYSNLKKETTNNLRCCETIQYGYIKLRDLKKWENGEIVAVKMGMLTPSKPVYKNLSIIDAACKRISEQDTTALFEDEDELIPVYVFVSEITDNEWREHLISKGFKSSRKTASREGIKIDKKNLFGEYGFFFKEDTKESKSIVEEKRAEEEREYQEYLKEQARIKKAKEKEAKEKEKRFQESVEEYNKIYGDKAFDKDYEEMSKKYGVVKYDITNKKMFSIKEVTTKEWNPSGEDITLLFFFGFFTILFFFCGFSCISHEIPLIDVICIMLGLINLFFTIIGICNLDSHKTYSTEKIYVRKNGFEKYIIDGAAEIVVLTNKGYAYPFQSDIRNNTIKY